MVDGIAMTEDGEVLESLPMFAASMPSHIWMVDDAVTLLTIMMDMFADHPDFNYQIVTSEDDTDGPRFVRSRLTRFGFTCHHEGDERAKCPWRRHVGMHIVWTPSDLSPTPNRILPQRTRRGFLELATDIRAWCQEQNLPVTTSLAGIANSLIRDERFWPEARGRVPRATNENLRQYLPGVYSELQGDTYRTYNVISLDQRAAYHVAATEVAAPDPTTLFARGYYNLPDTGPVWCNPDDPLYHRTMQQPGLIYAIVDVQPLRKHQTRPPAVAAAGHYRAALWTNEVQHAEANGVTVKGLIAAWTSNLPDVGLPHYGTFAQGELARASALRRRWLKPTLHALYGLFGVRPRRLSIGHYRGRGKEAIARLGFAHEFPVHNAELGSVTGPTANVATLGTLQSEIRRRSLSLATELSRQGATVLHIHADGVHIEATNLPLIPPHWKIESLNRLHYIDKNSWTADERDCLPGRDERMRVEARRRAARAPRGSEEPTNT